MSPAMAGRDRGWSEEETFVEVLALDRLYLPVDDIERATNFYARLFGFARLRADVGAAGAKAALGRAGRARLLLTTTAPTEVPAIRVTAVVENLDLARETAWDMGIPVIRDIDDTTHAGARPRRSFVTRDPDGHEIELIEQNKQRIDWRGP